MKTSETAVRRWWPVAAASAYWTLLCWWSRGIRIDCSDGVNAIGNSLRLGGVAPFSIFFDPRRPPAAEFFATPVASLAYVIGGPHAAVAAVHAAMAAVFAVVLVVSHRFYRALFPELVAGTLFLLLACNPILIQFAPFAMQDIFASLSTLVFVWASYRYLQRPDSKRYWVFMAAYTLAILSKYPLGTLILAPLLYRAVDPALGRAGLGRRLARLFYPPLLVAPIVSLAAAFAVLATLKLASGDNTLSILSAVGLVVANGRENLIGGLRSETFNEMLLDFAWRGLGPALWTLLAAGWTLWCFERDGLGRYLALTLAVLFGFVSALPDPEVRYLIPAIPIAYAAVGRALTELLEVAGRERWKRLMIAALCLAVVPWPVCRRAARFLRSDPAFHTSLVDNLARVLGTSANCVTWSGGDLELWHDDALFRSEEALLVGPSHVSLWTGKRVGRGNPVKGMDCDLTVATVGSLGQRPKKDALLARIYDKTSGPGARAWDVYLDGLRPAKSQ